MLHLLHPSLPRAAALAPYRLRHQLLVAATSAVAITLLLNTAVRPAADHGRVHANRHRQPGVAGGPAREVPLRLGRVRQRGDEA